LATGLHAGYLVAPLLVRAVDDLVLLLRPGRLLDLRIEVVVPPLAALLPDPALKMLGDLEPILQFISFDRNLQF
jgi:hypothetical protein